MNEENKIQTLLTAFYGGTTTPEEEQILQTYFANHEVSEQLRADSELFKVLNAASAIIVPDGMSERLENALDKHIKLTIKRKGASKTRILYLRILSAAAIVLLCIGLFFNTFHRSNAPLFADSYSNPEEAAIAVEQALLFLSSKLNQGLAPYEKFSENLNKTNELLNQNFSSH